MVIFSPCTDCKYFHEHKNNTPAFSCSAYPEGIPKEVFWDGTGNLCSKKNAEGIHFTAFHTEDDTDKTAQ